MCPQDDLLVGRQNSLNQGGMFSRTDFAAPRQSAEIVHPFEDNQITHPSLREHVTIKARERIGPQAIGQKMVAAIAMIENPDIPGRGRILQPSRQNIGPTIVTVGGSAVSIRNGVPQGDEGSAAGAGRHIHTSKLIPVIHFFSVGQVGSRHLIAMHQVGSGARAGMARL